MFTNLPIIVTTANSEYILPLTVLLISIERNLPNGHNASVFILHRDMKESIQCEINNCLAGNKLKIKWVKIDPQLLTDLKVDGHISIDTYNRLLIEELFPSLSKVIYLDADIVVTKSLCHLWNQDIKEVHLLAVPNASKLSGVAGGSRGIPSYRSVGLPSDSRTFNAGVMILNLELWRRDSISAQVIKYLRKFRNSVLWWDQEGLNVVLNKRWQRLDPRWNVMTCHLRTFTSHFDSFYSPKDYELVTTQPFIVHYAGPEKPWHENYDGPFKEVFHYYAEMINRPGIKKLHIRTTTSEKKAN